MSKIRKVKIDGNEKAAAIMPLYHENKVEESRALELEVLTEIKESGQNLCPCLGICERAGNCVDCILLHRAHKDHLPRCLWKMVRERVPDHNGLCDEKPRSGSKLNPYK
ncbi:MAG: hypothetical protein ACOX25_04245 [Caldicoprobacterales bacterium]|jgi:hypothetical protein|nr:hypothetical protein [Clostridiales bacterium]